LNNEKSQEAEHTIADNLQRVMQTATMQRHIEHAQGNKAAHLRNAEQLLVLEIALSVAPRALSLNNFNKTRYQFVQIHGSTCFGPKCEARWMYLRSIMRWPIRHELIKHNMLAPARQLV
jgi:hypothetical protein